MSEDYDIEITKGFFWLKGTAFGDKEDSNIIQHNNMTNILTHHCVFYQKPKWYQIKKWWQAFNYWRKL